MVVLLMGFAGLLAGSFLNVVIHRLPRMLEARWQRECGTAPADEAVPNLAWPGSRCPACLAPIRPWHNIPLLGYVLLRGRCADCRAPISRRYPLVESLTACLFMLLAWQGGSPLWLAGQAVFVAMLMALVFIDLEHGLLPDDLTQPLLWTGLLFNATVHAVPLEDAVFGAVLGYGILWAVFHVHRLSTGKEGIGQGDFKLMAALGAWLGWQMVPLVLFLSSVMGVAGGLWLMLRGRLQPGQPFPFGPYLAAAGLLVCLQGEIIARWYWDAF